MRVVVRQGFYCTTITERVYFGDIKSRWPSGVYRMPGEVKDPAHIHSESLCLSDETLKAVGPFYLVSMPGEVKDPTQGVNA